MKKIFLSILFIETVLGFGFTPICCCKPVIDSMISSFESNIESNILIEIQYINEINQLVNQELPVIKQRYNSNGVENWNSGLYGLKNVEDLTSYYEAEKYSFYAKKNVNFKILNQKIVNILNKLLILHTKQKYYERDINVK